MKKLFIVLSVLAVSLLGYSQAAHAWGTTGGDASRFSQVQETAVFFNNSGSTLAAGQVVILDTGGSGVNTGTTLGSYVTRTSRAMTGEVTRADATTAVGVVRNTTLDQRPITVVTKGPIATTCDDSSDPVTIGASVGTSAETNGSCGGGTNLGVALETGDGTDGDSIVIWVQGIGTE